jgi:Ca2+-binding RTX toxin-like protein
MSTFCTRVFLSVTITLLLVFGPGCRGGEAVARPAQAANAKTWLDEAVAEKHCPLSPVNIPPALQQTSAAVLQQQLSVVGDALHVEGAPNPNHVVISAGGVPGVVRVEFDGTDLGSFGPIARIVVRGGPGDDVLIVEPSVDLPVRLEGGAGDDCLQGGSGGDQLFGGPGNDVLIAGTGRPAVVVGPGSNRVVFPPSMGELRIARSAGGEFLALIAHAYTLQPLLQNKAAPPGQNNSPPSPIILGPADVADAQVVPLLQETYAAGQAIVLLNATAADYAQLRALLGHPNTAEGLKDGETAALVFVRKASRPGTKTYDYSTGIFHHAPSASALVASSHLDKRKLELLTRIFSATAIVPRAPRSSPSNDLLKIADSYTSSSISENSSGSQVQVVNSVWDVRSFQNQADFYYVLQEVDYYWGSRQSAPLGLFWVNAVNSDLDPILVSPTLIQPSPASTNCGVSTTSGVSWDIGGGAGWNQAQGLNAAVSGGVSISNSKTITCPQIVIRNSSNPAAGQTEWTYTRRTPNSQILNSFYNQWIWEVPFSAYSTGQQKVDINSGASSTFCFPFPIQNCNPLVTVLDSGVPLPFGDTFALQKPVVLSVNPTCVNAGNTFTINGTAFYPSLVTSVLIDGTPLASGQLSTASDTAINVVAPEQSGEYLPVVVQTTQGVSNSNVTIEISVIDLCP